MAECDPTQEEPDLVCVGEDEKQFGIEIASAL